MAKKRVTVVTLQLKVSFDENKFDTEELVEKLNQTLQTATSYAATDGEYDDVDVGDMEIVS